MHLGRSGTAERRRVPSPPASMIASVMPFFDPIRQFFYWSFPFQLPYRFPGPADNYPPDARLFKDVHGFPAMCAGHTTEDHGLVHVPDTIQIGADTIHGYIMGAGNMPLVEFRGGAQVDDHPALTQSLPDLFIASE